jgi:Holliday junction resolvasome RuvABC endonuclease subunit
MMVMHLLSLTGKPSEDAADALAVSICHCHSIANQSLCR